MLDRLQRVRQTGDLQWEALCPVHDDTEPSLCIGVSANDGRVLINCQAGCDTTAIVQAIGLRMRDLFPPSNGNGRRRRGLGSPVRTYDYLDEAGRLLFQVCRFHPPGQNKTFRQRAPGPDGSWTWRTRDVRKIPYGLPKVRQDIRQGAPILWVAEGEKDAEAIWRTGQTATCNPEGAGGWRHHFWRDIFQGLELPDTFEGVRIVADPDEAGRRHARAVLASYREFRQQWGAPLPEAEATEPPGDRDVHDHLEAGGALEDLEALRAEAAPDVSANGGGGGPSPDLRGDAPFWPWPHNDTGNAHALNARHGQDMRWCDPFERWYIWDGQVWKPDHSCRSVHNTQSVGDAIREAAKEAWEQAARTGEEEDERTAKRLSKWGNRSAMTGKRHGMLSCLKPLRPVTPEQFDSDPMLLNVQNGIVDIGDGGVLRPHDRDAHFTQIAPVEYHPEAEAPTWEAFLDTVLAGDRAMIAYLQRLVGTTLIGLVPQLLAFLHGAGNNGKSTFLGVLNRMLGGYATIGDPELLVPGNQSDPRLYWLAELRGVRLATFEEPDTGRLDEPAVKRLTGGTEITARSPYGRPFTFRPQATLFLASNSKPQVRGTDEGIWRRMRLIPFEVEIPKEDVVEQYDEILMAEAPGILAWCVRGALDYLERGEAAPRSVSEATQDYRNSQDLLGGFLSECCDIMPQARIATQTLYDAFREWCQDAGLRPWSKMAFARAISERGFTNKTPGGSILRVTRNGRRMRAFQGLCLIPREAEERSYKD